MSRKLQENALWREEVEKHGFEGALRTRLRFHGGLSLADVVALTGYSKPIVLKMFGKFVTQGEATWAQGQQFIRPTNPLTREETHPHEVPIAKHWRELISDDEDSQRAIEARIRDEQPAVAKLLDHLSSFGLWPVGRCGWTYFHGWLDSVWSRAYRCDPARFVGVDQMAVTRAVFPVVRERLQVHA